MIWDGNGSAASQPMEGWQSTGLPGFWPVRKWRKGGKRAWKFSIAQLEKQAWDTKELSGSMSLQQVVCSVWESFSGCTSAGVSDCCCCCSKFLWVCKLALINRHCISSTLNVLDGMDGCSYSYIFLKPTAKDEPKITIVPYLWRQEETSVAGQLWSRHLRHRHPPIFNKSLSTGVMRHPIAVTSASSEV